MPSLPDNLIPIRVSPAKMFLDWDTVEALAREVRQAMEANLYTPERILALGKGAMIPARLIAREETPINYVGVRSYAEEGERGEISCYQDIHPLSIIGTLNDPSTLIVDDLWDSGETFRYAKNRWPMAKTAALLSKTPADETCLDYIGLPLPTSSWIVFPWE